MPPRILIAEPSRTLASLIRLTLADVGATLTLVSDGQDAARAVAEAMPSLIITDAELPGLDGYAFVGAVRRLAGGREVPVLLTMSVHHQPDPERIAFLGIEEVLTKPFERAALLERIRGMLPRATQTYEAPTAPEPVSASAATWPPAAPQPQRTPPPAPHSGLHARPPTTMSPRAFTRPTDPGALSAMVHAETQTSLTHTPRAVRRPGPATPQYDDEYMRGWVAHEVEQSLSGMVAAKVDEQLAGIVQRSVETIMERLIAVRVPSLIDDALSKTLPDVVRGVLEGTLPSVVSNAVHEQTASQMKALLANTLGDEAKRRVHTAADEAVAGALPEMMEYAAFGLGSKVEAVLRDILPEKLPAIAEKVVWKVVPAIAEDMIRVEIQRLIRDEDA